MQKISLFLWFDSDAEDAARFYVSLFPNSKINKIVSGPQGAAQVVNFDLNGQPVTALNGGPAFRFTEAVSLVVHCEDQAEVDRYWHALSEGGAPSRCGWLKDRYGFSWQVVPTEFLAMTSDPDPAKVARVMAAMMQMTKFDLAKLRAAFAG